MKKTQNESKKFLLEFFKNCKIEDKDEVLTVSDVPNDFEKFVGKVGPYKFVFDAKTHEKIKDSEPIMQGSYFLIFIRDYLENKGQTSLLKIQDGPQTAKIYKKLKIGAKNNTELLYEFSFISTYQYLNEKKQSINTILVKNDKIIDVDISKFKTIDGNKEDVQNINAEEQYKIAINKLKEMTKKEIKQIKTKLKAKLDKELARVRDHYSKRIKEKDEEVENCANKIKMLESKRKHTSYERDRNILARLIRESMERLEILKKKGYKERLEIEENFQIKDEVEKHALSIKNNLMNVTIYY